VQLTLSFGLAGKIAAKGLDLLESAAFRVVAISTASDEQLVVCAFERDLSLVGVTTPRSDGFVPGHAFPRIRRHSEPNIEITDTGGKFTEVAYAYA
jgi:hypothetical protein